MATLGTEETDLCREFIRVAIMATGCNMTPDSAQCNNCRFLKKALFSIYRLKYINQTNLTETSDMQYDQVWPLVSCVKK